VHRRHLLARLLTVGLDPANVLTATEAPLLQAMPPCLEALGTSTPDYTLLQGFGRSTSLKIAEEL
jgi:hypothetical protein